MICHLFITSCHTLGRCRCSGSMSYNNQIEMRGMWRLLYLWNCSRFLTDAWPLSTHTNIAHRSSQPMKHPQVNDTSAQRRCCFPLLVLASWATPWCDTKMPYYPVITCNKLFYTECRLVKTQLGVIVSCFHLLMGVCVSVLHITMLFSIILIVWKKS